MLKLRVWVDPFEDGTLAVFCADMQLQDAAVAIQPFQGNTVEELAAAAIKKYFRKRGENNDDDLGRPDDPLR